MKLRLSSTLPLSPAVMDPVIPHGAMTFPSSPAPSAAPDESLHITKRRLLDVGLATLLERGYNATGIQDLLVATSVPKGSFYHHFVSKEDFALQVIDRYLVEVHALLEQSLGDMDRAPLDRVRSFFERLMALYASQG